jgi:hypothetical protein
MTIVTEAKGALQNGTSAVLATVQRRRKATRRLAGINPDKLLKQVTRRFEARRTRRVPLVPIAIAASAAVVGVVVGTIVLCRYLAAGCASEEAIPVAEEIISANEHVEALEPTFVEH